MTDSNLKEWMRWRSILTFLVVLLACGPLLSGGNLLLPVFHEASTVKLPGALVSDAECASRLAMDAYFHKSSGLSAMEGPSKTILVELGFSVKDYAKIGDKIWEVRITVLTKDGNHALRAIVWIHSQTGLPYFLCFPSGHSSGTDPAALSTAPRTSRAVSPSSPAPRTSTRSSRSTSRRSAAPRAPIPPPMSGSSPRSASSSRRPRRRARGYTAGRFSFNVKGGRCEVCGGDGVRKLEMSFLPDVYVTCEQCGGRRFNAETLEVAYAGKNIADVLAMTVAEAKDFFAKIPSLARKLVTLDDVGLGYIQLGQSATTLSGGEAQRIKLATELSRRSTGRTLYLLDEPTTGLHFDDVDKLMKLLLRLRDQGNTVIVIEHNTDVMKCADWIVDLGPGGGDAGGRVVCEGPIDQVRACKESFTAKYL